MSFGPAKTPWHLWVIGVLYLLWSLMGAVDYVMTKTGNEAYLENLTPEQLEFYTGFPLLINITWAFAVWGGVVGAILILFKSRFAVLALLISLASMIINMVHMYVLNDGAAISGLASLVFSCVIFVFALCVFFYARGMKKRGVLR